MANQYRLFALSSAQKLGETISQQLDMPLGQLYCTQFSDGEVFTRFDETIRGDSVILIAQANMPYSNLFELLVTVDAARRAFAREIICVVPYLPHSRQERKEDDRTAISSRMLAGFLENAGVDRIITMDLHTRAIEGFYTIPIGHISMSGPFVEHIRQNFNMEDMCLCSPDFGGVKRVKKFRNHLNCSMAVIQKERLQPNQVANMEIIGEVKGKDVVIVDDMIDTAGTLCKAAQLLLDEGARSVTAYITHGILSGPALERINSSPITKLVIADTIPYDAESDKIEVIPCAPIFGKAIGNLIYNKSFVEFND